MIYQTQQKSRTVDNLYSKHFSNHSYRELMDANCGVFISSKHERSQLGEQGGGSAQSTHSLYAHTFDTIHTQNP